MRLLRCATCAITLVTLSAAQRPKHWRLKARQLPVSVGGSGPPSVDPPAVSAPVPASPAPAPAPISTPISNSPPPPSPPPANTPAAPVPVPAPPPNSPVAGPPIGLVPSLLTVPGSSLVSTPLAVSSPAAATSISTVSRTESSATSTSDDQFSTSFVVISVSGTLMSSSMVVNLQASVSNNADDEDSSNVKAWAIPVGVIGGCIGAGLLGFLLWTCVIKKRFSDDPADFDAPLRWPSLPGDDSHLPASATRQTGRAGIGEDGDGQSMSQKSSPQWSKSGHSRDSSMMDAMVYPRDQEPFQQYQQEQYQQYYNDPYMTIKGGQLILSQAGLAPAVSPTTLTSRSFTPPTPGTQYFSPEPEAQPVMPWNKDSAGLARHGSVQSVQSIAGQRPLGVANPDR